MPSRAPPALSSDDPLTAVSPKHMPSCTVIANCLLVPMPSRARARPDDRRCPCIGTRQSMALAGPRSRRCRRAAIRCRPPHMIASTPHCRCRDAPAYDRERSARPAVSNGAVARRAMSSIRPCRTDLGVASMHPTLSEERAFWSRAIPAMAVRPASPSPRHDPPTTHDGRKHRRRDAYGRAPPDHPRSAARSR